MSTKYKDDKRVEQAGSGYKVAKDGRTFRIYKTGVFGWVVEDGQTDQFLILDVDGKAQMAIGFTCEDDAFGLVLEGLR